MSLINSIVMFLLLASVVSGCSTRSQTWVVGQDNQLSHLDRSDLQAGTKSARNYIEAWAKEDYRKLWTLRNKHCRGFAKWRDYQSFLKLTRTWREKGVVQEVGSSIAAADAGAINKSLTLLNGVSDEQARILLSLAPVDDAVFDQLKDKSWPDRVMLMKLRIAAHESVIMLAKEDGQWSVVNDPGTLDKSMIGGALPGF